MISWQSVFFTSLWIIGLAIILSALSYHYWLAQTHGQSLRKQLGSRSFLGAFWIAVFFFSIGLLGSSRQLWEMVIWGLLGLWAVINLAGVARGSAT